jgi:hypothetical protein
MDELSTEDQFRLNVLLAQDIKAIRIDESTQTLHALTGQGEASMPLHPNCRSDRYFRILREQLSGHTLGSPGGYPVYLSRWTRHSQMESEHLGQLLLIGEPEAVVAVVHSPSLTDELARYAWWAMPTIENARLMLMREAVSKGEMGTVLTEFLVEHLPFLQEDHLAIMDTVAVLLYAGTLTPTHRQAIWRRGKRQNSYYVAFLEMCPDDIPVGDFIEACIEILNRPETQEVVSRTLDAIGKHFSRSGDSNRFQGQDYGDEHLYRLGQVNSSLTDPIFARSTAIGSLMRRKIEPVTAPILADLKQLVKAK